MNNIDLSVSWYLSKSYRLFKNLLDLIQFSLQILEINRNISKIFFEYLKSSYNIIKSFELMSFSVFYFPKFKN